MQVHWIFATTAPLPFDTYVFEGEEILTHHISNSMLKLIHEQNTQAEKHNSFTKRNERNEQYKDGTIFCVV